MKNKHRLSAGGITEAAVPDGTGAAIAASRKTEHDQEGRNGYHRCSPDTMGYESLEHGKRDEYPSEDESAEQAERVKAAFNRLTRTQQRRFRLYADGKTPEEIAAQENVSVHSVSVSIEAARKKFLKNYRAIP